MVWVNPLQIPYWEALPGGGGVSQWSDDLTPCLLSQGAQSKRLAPHWLLHNFHRMLSPDAIFSSCFGARPGQAEQTPAAIVHSRRSWIGDVVTQISSSIPYNTSLDPSVIRPLPALVRSTS